MNEPLTLALKAKGMGVDLIEVTGFDADELETFEKMPYALRKEAVLRAIDYRNGGQATRWYRDVGVYGVMMKEGGVLIEIGDGSGRHDQLRGHPADED